MLPAPMLDTLFATSVFNQNSLHGLGGGGKEMSPSFPLLGNRVGSTHQPQIGFVHKSRPLQRLAGFLPGYAVHGQSPQFVIYQRKQLIRCGMIAFFDAMQNICQVRHFTCHDSMEPVVCQQPDTREKNDNRPNLRVRLTHLKGNRPMEIVPRMERLKTLCK